MVDLLLPADFASLKEQVKLMKNFYLVSIGSLAGSDDVLGYLRAEMPSDES